MAGGRAAYDRAIDFLHTVEERSSTRKEPWTWGTGFFHDNYPTKWDLNYLRLERRPEPAEVDAVMAEAERIFEAHGFRHRKIHADHPDGGDLAGGFDDVGWSTETLEIMVLQEPTSRRSRIPVEEIGGAEIRPPTYEWYRQTLPVTEEEAINLRDSVGAVEHAVNTRYFAVRAPRGVVSWCHLYQEEEVAQIEEVSTFERYRGRGYATATVLRAIEEAKAAGARLIFLVADANDWPKDMYMKLGFQPVGRIYEYSKLPPA